MTLGIGGDAIEDAETISQAGALETELSTKTEPVPPAPKRKLDSMNFATLGTPLQDEEHIRGLGFNEPTTTTKLSPNAPGEVARNADINSLFTITGGQSNIAMPPLQVQEKSTTEAPLAFDQEVLFKQLRYFSMLVQDLLKGVDAPRYKITLQSRLRMKGGIAGLHEGERRELEKMWGCTALQKAEQRLDSFIEEFEELPTRRRSVPSVFSANDSSLLHSASTSHSEDSFASNLDDRPSPVLTTKPSVHDYVPRFCRPPKKCSKKGSRLQKDSEAEGHAKNTTDNIGQSTDAPFIGYLKPHRQYSCRESRANVPFQPSTSAASMHFYSGFTSHEAGVDVRTPTSYVDVYSGQLMLRDRKATACHSTATSIMWIYLRTLISSSSCTIMILISIILGSRGQTEA